MLPEEVIAAVKRLDAKEHHCDEATIQIIEVREIEPNHPDRVLKPYPYTRDDGTRAMTGCHLFTHIVTTRYGCGRWGSLYGIEDTGKPWLWMD